MVTVTSRSTLQPSSVATNSVGVEVDGFVDEAMTPFFIRHLTTSAPVFFIRLASSPTEISSGNLDLDRGLLGNFQLQAAHPFGLILLALVGESHIAPTLIAVAELFLAAAL